MTDILVVNNSSLVTDREAAAMTRACAYQVHHHASPYYGTAGVHFVTPDEEPQPGDWVLYLMDDPDQAGALGWHDQEGEVIYGRVFARPSLAAGSTALTGPYSISSVLSHEILETLGDPHINDWVEGPNGLLVAREIGDPVEAFTYAYHDRWAGDIALSDFVTPEWFDPASSAGEEYDFLGQCPAPLHLTSGGYWIQAGLVNETSKFARHVPDGAETVHAEDRNVTYVFGPDYPDWKRDLKLATPGGRGSRRVAA